MKTKIGRFLCLLACAAGALGAGQNLLPEEGPETSLWYPPFATTQPVRDAEGGLRVPLSAAAGKAVCVLTVSLPEGKLADGTTYAFSAEAKASLPCRVIVQMPQFDPEGKLTAKGEPAPLAQNFALQDEWRPVRGVFVYDRQANKGAVSWVWVRKAIETQAVVELRGFKLEQLP